MYTGERQAAKMRMAYLKSMLSQDISLFDTEASTGEVTAAITSDIIVVQDAISEKACIPLLIIHPFFSLLSFFFSFNMCVNGFKFPKKKKKKESILLIFINGYSATQKLSSSKKKISILEI